MFWKKKILIRFGEGGRRAARGKREMAWKWIVRRTRESKPFFFAFATICGVVPGVIGYGVMQLTNTRNEQLETHLRRSARPESLVTLSFALPNLIPILFYFICLCIKFNPCRIRIRIIVLVLFTISNLVYTFAASGWELIHCTAVAVYCVDVICAIRYFDRGRSSLT